MSWNGYLRTKRAGRRGDVQALAAALDADDLDAAFAARLERHHRVRTAPLRAVPGLRSALARRSVSFDRAPAIIEERV